MIGVVVMNYHGYLILRGGRAATARSTGSSTRGPGRWRPASRPRSCSPPASASPCSPAARSATRTSCGRGAGRLIRRGLVLYGFGLLFDTIWPGTILPFYGAMFVIAAGLFTLRTGWIVATGLAAALAGAGIAWWGFERRLDGHDTAGCSTRRRLAAGAALRRLRQRHPPAVAVARLLLRRNRARPAAANGLVAAGAR